MKGKKNKLQYNLFEVLITAYYWTFEAGVYIFASVTFLWFTKTNHQNDSKNLSSEHDFKI